MSRTIEGAIDKSLPTIKQILFEVCEDLHLAVDKLEEVIVEDDQKAYTGFAWEKWFGKKSPALPGGTNLAQAGVFVRVDPSRVIECRAFSRFANFALRGVDRLLLYWGPGVNTSFYKPSDLENDQGKQRLRDQITFQLPKAIEGMNRGPEIIKEILLERKRHQYLRETFRRQPSFRF